MLGRFREAPMVPAAAVATMAASAGVSTQVVVAVASESAAAALWSASLFPSLADDPSGLEAIAFEEIVSLGNSVPKVLAASPVDPDLTNNTDQLVIDVFDENGDETHRGAYVDGLEDGPCIERTEDERNMHLSVRR